MKKLILSTLVLALSLVAVAQQPQPLPIDSAVRVGKLENGLTYYIRHNEHPKQRAEFHIAQAVGATMEEDHQNGLAHFLEHMAFNGTEHFAGKGIIEYFESIGVNFGGNINAYTSLDETVYRLSEVPTVREGIIDSALLVMHDWACGLSLLEEEIDNERGVIREEWRTGAQANRRMWKAINPLKYPGSQYAKRDVIGDTAVINNFTYDALRDYYKKWYGPDNQAIIVVGDIDVDQVEQKIKALWADVPERVNRGERPLYSVDDNVEPIVAIVRDKEAQYTRIEMEFKKDQLPKPLRGTNVSYLQNLALELVCDMFNNRLSELAMKPEATFVGAGSYHGELVKEKDAFVAVYLAKQGQEVAAYKDLLTQLEKMRRYGFTYAELDRVKKEMLAAYEKSYNERNTVRNIRYAQEYIRHYLSDEPIPGIAWEYETVQQLLPMLSVDMLNQIAKNLVTDENLIISFQAPEDENVVLPTEAEAVEMLAAVKNEEIEAPVEEAIRENLVETAPKAGKIKKTTYNETLGVTEWTLSNGVRVIVKPTTFKQDEILFQGVSKGGASLVATEDLPSSMLASTIVDFSGLADMSLTDLQKALTGKNVSHSVSINNNTEVVSGSSTVKDLETLLQINYLSFTAPRRDEEAYQTLMSVLNSQLANRDKNPKVAFSDSIQMMANDHSSRIVLQDLAWLEKVNLDKALEVYKARFANPADFVFTFVGNVDPADKVFQKMVCTWLGGLKTSKKKESVRDNGVRAPEGINKNYFTRPMEIKTASNRIQYTSYDMPYTLANDLNMEMIGRILSTRYLESIREREGGSYGVGCWGTMEIVPVPCARLIMQFDTDPEKQEKLMSIIHEEVMTIVENGPLAKDLQKEKESMLKDFQEDLEKNGYWRQVLDIYYRFGINYITDYKAAVEAITAETVQATLKQLVASGNVFEVVMLP
ncbi:MAG: insulinase family protein [Paludibacteraceae bacterium]|nr:insulinase family protein [Paludibacteraceae bacterium]